MNNEHKNMHEHEHKPEVTIHKKSKFKTYLPLIFVVLAIIIIMVVIQVMQKEFTLMSSLRYFMGLFFLFFGIFKTLDWKGFAHAYAEYDIVAKRSKIYSFIYPAIELTLGILFLAGLFPIIINAITAVIMFISSIGVIQSLVGKKKIRCACLGTVVKLPMSTITVIEDVGMGVMAVVMLILNIINL